MTYVDILLQDRRRELSLAVESKSHQLLATQLRRAAAEHHTFEVNQIREGGEPDKDWADWYARFMLGQIVSASDRAERVPTPEEQD